MEFCKTKLNCLILLKSFIVYEEINSENHVLIFGYLNQIFLI